MQAIVCFSFLLDFISYFISAQGESEIGVGVGVKKVVMFHLTDRGFLRRAGQEKQVMAQWRLTKYIRTGGKGMARFMMNHYVKLKPLFNWMPVKTRASLKNLFLSPVFKILYSSQALSEIDNVSLARGVTLVGYPRADIGEGEFLRQTAGSFLQAGVPFGIYDYDIGVKLSRTDDRFISNIRTDNPYSVNIFHLKPDQSEASVVALGDSFVGGRYNIGYWLWELRLFPELWIRPLKYFHEIWCPSRFVQSAIAERSTRPVRYMPPTIEIAEPEGFDRTQFKLPAKPFLFLFVFDFKSHVSRKNPIGCVRAFQRAFPNGDETAGLVIKSMDGDRYPEEFRRLTEEVQNDPRITLIDAMFTVREVLGLMKVCDAFVSLHRSEGIGLCLAQSMLLGKPVIATSYSGNTDFTLPDNSCLVDFSLIPVKDGEYPFWEGQVWADPSIDHAADYMRQLVADKTYCKKIAEAGRSYIKTFHSAEAVGKVYRSRLVELGALDE